MKGKKLSLRGPQSLSLNALNPGPEDRVDIPFDAALNPDGSFTFEAWAKVTGRQGVQRTIVSADDNIDGVRAGFFLVADITDRWFFVTRDGGFGTGLRGPDIVLNEWTHLAISFEANGPADASGAFTGTMRMYVDGVLAAERATGRYIPRTSTLRDYFIGGGGGGRFQGNVDEIRLWDTNLTELQIQSRMNREVSGTEANLVAAWSFNEGQGNIVADRTGNHHGQLVDEASFSNDTPLLTANEIRQTFLVDGISVGDLVATDPGGNVNANSLQVSITDPQWFVTDLMPRALAFDDSRLDLQTKVFDGQSNVTTAFWLKKPDATIETVMRGFDATDSNYLTVFAGHGGIVLDTDSGGVFWNTDALADGEFHHIAIVRDQQNQRAELFVDGISEGFDTFNAPLETLDFADGGFVVGQNATPSGPTPDPRFHGAIDELAIFGRVLTPAEIADVMQGKIDSGSPSLRLWLPMNDGAGTTVADRGPLGLDASFHFPAGRFPNSTINDTEQPPTWTSETPSPFDGSLTFADNGTYTLTVTADDGDGGFDESVTTFTVGNVAPAITDLNVSDVGPYVIGAPIRMDARDVIDPGVTDSLTYLWEVTSNNGQSILTSDEIEFDFTPEFAGTYIVTLTVTDSDGDISIFPDPLNSAQVAAATFAVNPTVAITLPESNPVTGSIVTLSSADSSLLAPAGGLRGTNQTVTREFAWTITGGTQPVVGTSADIQFVPDRPGSYTVVLKIDDIFLTDGVEQSRLTQTETTAFTVDAAATISIVAATTATSSGALVNAAASEGDLLTFSIAGLVPLDSRGEREVQWSVSPNTFEIVPTSDPETFSIRATADDSYTISLTVIDTLLSTSVTRIANDLNLVVENAAPVIVADSVEGTENEPIEFTAEVFDAGLNDTHTYSIDWGDGSALTNGNVHRCTGIKPSRKTNRPIAHLHSRRNLHRNDHRHRQ
ncbi:MAG: LamG-like jellyroll fold domain-containing protein [Pirellulaceae bacterium]